MHSLLTVLFAFATILALALGVFAIAMARAPKGYEDDNGFHVGKEPPEFSDLR